MGKITVIEEDLLMIDRMIFREQWWEKGEKLEGKLVVEILISVLDGGIEDGAWKEDLLMIFSSETKI